MWSHTLDTQLDKLVREKVYDFGAVAEEIQVIYYVGNDNNNNNDNKNSQQKPTRKSRMTKTSTKKSVARGSPCSKRNQTSKLLAHISRLPGRIGNRFAVVALVFSSNAVS
jgi:hypothetical protein